MKNRWYDLTRPQRVILLFQVFLFALFLILYAVLGSQQVIEYQNTLFRRQADGDVISYSGKLNGEEAVFTVSPGPVVEYRWGDAVYGPYTIVRDSTAVPSEEDLPIYITSAKNLIGVEVREGSDVLFRGAFSKGLYGLSVLLSEDGASVSSEREFVEISPGVYRVDTTKPDVRGILWIAFSPETTHRGHWGIFLLGTVFCVLNAVSILYADELFRFHLGFRVKYPEDAEPSDWELFARWIGWIVITIAALAFFIFGLNAL